MRPGTGGITVNTALVWSGNTEVTAAAAVVQSSCCGLYLLNPNDLRLFWYWGAMLDMSNPIFRLHNVKPYQCLPLLFCCNYCFTLNVWGSFFLLFSHQQAGHILYKMRCSSTTVNCLFLFVLDSYFIKYLWTNCFCMRFKGLWIHIVLGCLTKPDKILYKGL